MTRAERLAILGPETVARLQKEAQAAPPPSAELIAALRAILTNPAHPRLDASPAAEQPAAA